MPGQFATSRQLIRESLAVLRQDPELIWFPIISGSVSLVILGSFAWPMYQKYGQAGPTGVDSYLYIFLFYLLSYFIVNFFNTGLITCVALRFQGKNPTFSDGWKNAVRHIGPIFLWSLLAATVGMILRALENRSGLIGRIVTSIIGMVWSLLTYFVVPLLVLENFSVPHAIRRSGELFKQTWGENVIGNVSIGLVFMLLMLAGIGVSGLIIVAAISLAGATGLVTGIIIGAVILMVLYAIVLGILQTTLQGIFNAALYIYTQTGTVMPGMSEELVWGAFRAKVKK